MDVMMQVCDLGYLGSWCQNIANPSWLGEHIHIPPSKWMHRKVKPMSSKLRLFTKAIWLAILFSKWKNKALDHLHKCLVFQFFLMVSPKYCSLSNLRTCVCLKDQRCTAPIRKISTLASNLQRRLCTPIHVFQISKQAIGYPSPCFNWQGA